MAGFSKKDERFREYALNASPLRVLLTVSAPLALYQALQSIFKVLDALVTNFHLPESTLIMLVSALAGREATLSAYEEAVKERYRFFSFGDAMFIS